jgi:hypothetical protein
MSQVLTVPTHFNDIGELSEGFLDRVESDTLILYGPVPYEDGAEIEFAVLLADGTAALGGTGRVRAAVDGGADRVPETRYDVVLEALSLDARSEVVFERLVIERQAVSENPPADEDAPATGEVDAVPESIDADEEFEMTVEQVDSLGPDVYDDDYEGEDPPTVLKEVDPAMLEAVTAASDGADTDAELETVVETDPEADVDTGKVSAVEDDESELEVSSESDMAQPSEPVLDVQSDAGFESDEPVAMNDEVAADDEVAVGDEVESEDEPELSYDAPAGHEDEIAAVLANANATEISIESDGMDSEDDDGSESAGRMDSMYAFEHGISAEPKVGMPVPMPSMAAPPMAPPAPPRLRLAEPPDGLTRPTLAEPEESGFTVDGEVSDVHQTGMFAYEDGLPIPDRPPLPDPNRAKQVPTVEAANDYDVQDSEPAELLSDGYEEVRLSDFAEAVEEG